MKLHISKIKLIILTIVAIAMGALFMRSENCFAAQISYSPIRYNRVLIPGSEDELTITLAVPSNATGATHYELEVRPFYIDDNEETHFEAKENYSLITDWINIPEEDKQGTLQSGESKKIVYTISVPENAPAGGQYAVMVVKTYDDTKTDLKQIYEMTQAIYAEVAGETIRQGEINSLSVPSFLLSGNLTASASVKNLGNVHSYAKHVLKVFPLVGNEEFYTNEEEPKESMVMPDATRYTSTEWENTPSVGIFRVVYTVEFEGVKNELEKIVIVCPIWLLIIIFVLILLLVFRIVTSRKRHE